VRVRIRGALRLTSALGAVTLAIGILSAGTLAAGAATTRPAAAAKSGPKVLLVGTYHGKKGGYTSIQAAVNAARPGDWILVGPGDYHETADETTGEYGNPADGAMGGVFIHKNGITLRGMNRSTVIVDGTMAGASPCSSQPSEQNYGRVVDGQPVGRNGILVWKANDVSVENLTVCNFLAGTGDSGNEVWWNGGDNSGKIGETGYWGSYLTATSTFFSSENTAAEYGIFASNSAGPATWNQLYASNMNDSGTYVGACKQRCDMVMDHMWMENNALGYSGTNSGGTVVIENSQFDHNQDGLDTNTQIIGDPPAPQNGRCPHGRSRITHTTSCWVVIHNYIHNNNNNMAPAAGSAAAGPVGTGMTVSGGRFDTVMDNKIVNNGAWGVLFVPYAQSGTPSLHQTCAGVGGHEFPGFGCVMDPEGDALLHNWFGNDGYFHNPSNSDFGQITLFGGEPQNCFAGNRDPNGSAPGNLEKAYRRCGATTKAGNSGGELFTQVLCDTGLSSCPANAHYPKVGGRVVLKRVPRNLPTMPNPCAGVPANPWCPRGGQHWTGNGGTRTVAAALVMTGARAAARMQPGLFLFL
jgi:hypothetical protein